MKKIVLFFPLLIVSVSAFCTIRTVSNNPDRPGQFADVNSAIAAAVAGDTIYVHGSQFIYPDFTISKQLVLIGAGYNSNNQFNQPTRVNTIFLSRDTGLQNSSGSIITGFLVSTHIQNIGIPGPTNITIFRNQVNNTIFIYNTNNGVNYGSGWVIYNNLVNVIQGGSSGSTSSSASNITIQNNIISGVINGFSVSSILIDHNIFLNSDNLSTLFYATITNNIFTRTTGNLMSTSVNFNTFNNNLSNLTTVSPNAPTNSFAGGSNTASGNFVTVDPLYESVSNLNTYSSSANYRLKTTSTVRNAGTDGTDLGIYGGPVSRIFPSGGAAGSGYDTSALPPIPQVTEVNIQNATLQPGTPLNVNVKARINN